MEKTLTGHEMSYTELFSNIGRGNYLHVPLDSYSKAGVQTECTRQNKYVQSPNFLDKKFATSTATKDGYITIYQRR